MNNFFSAPYTYDFINKYNGDFNPSTVHVKNTALAGYFRRYYLQKAISVFDWIFPEEWSVINADNYFLYVLYCWGFIGIIETDKYGIIPQQCTLSGYNIVYQPARLMINNPLIKRTLEPRINIEAALIQLQPDYLGILDIVDHYAQQKALLSEALAVNAVNSKLSFVFGANNKAQAESLKELYDKIMGGDPAVFIDSKLFDNAGNLQMTFINKDVKGSYIITDLLNDIKMLDDMFNTEIGIPNANHDKKERLLVDEVNANNFETKSKAQIWLETLKRGCKTARDLFGISLDVDWRKDLVVSAEAQKDPASDGGGAADE